MNPNDPWGPFSRYSPHPFSPGPPHRKRPLLFHILMLPAYLLIWVGFGVIGILAIVVAWLLLIGIVLVILNGLGIPVHL